MVSTLSHALRGDIYDLWSVAMAAVIWVFGVLAGEFCVPVFLQLSRNNELVHWFRCRFRNFFCDMLIDWIICAFIYD